MSNTRKHGMIRMKGTLKAEAPLQVSYPDMEGKLPRTPHGEVFLNGGTLRGPLRKCALKAIRRLLADAQDVPEKGLLSLTDEYMLGSGIDRTREVNNERSEGVDPLAEQMLREINPLLSLFGRWNLPSRLECSEMRTPESNLMVAGQGVRHDQFERDPDNIEMLSEADTEALLREARSARQSADDMAEIRHKIAKTKRAYGEALDAGKKTDATKIGAELNELQDAEKEARESREGSDQSIMHPLAGFQAIAPESDLSARMTLVNGKEAYLGILLHALAEFSRHPVLGGHHQVGAGTVSGELEVYHWPVGKLSAAPIGTVWFDDMGFHMEGEALHEAFDLVASADWLKQCNFHTHTLKAARELQGEA